MKILVIGDTHGKLNKVRDIWTKLRNIDLIIHTGDHMSDGEALGKEFGVPVAVVKGNCDGGYSKNDFICVDTEYGKILVTHGHMENVQHQFNTIMYKAAEHQCKAAVFGHTHRPMVTESDGFYLINPGSLTQPRDGSDGSYAIIRTTANTLDASIVYYSTIMGGKKKTQAGYIRSLLNYSDRF